MKNVAVYLACKASRQLLSLGDSDGTIVTADYDGRVPDQPNLLFWIVDAGDGYCNLIHRRTGMVLDGDNDKAYLHVPDGGDYQKWKLEDAGDGYVMLVQKAVYTGGEKMS